MVPAVQALEQKGADPNQEHTDPDAITESKLT